VQVYAALRSKERVLAGGTHAHSPAAKAQEAEQRAIDGDRRCDQDSRPE
jgi:hypothetical protein